MVSTDLVRKIRYLKANPKLAELIPQSDMLSLMGDLLSGLQALQKGIETNKITGPKGADGYTPRPDVDYASLRSFDQALSAFEAKYNQISNRLDSKLSTIQNGKDGIVSDDEIARAADLASQLIELPDFDALIRDALTSNPGATRDGLELLQGDDRLSIEAIKGLQERFEELGRYAATVGGTVGKQQVYSWIRQAVTDGTIPTSGPGSVTVETPTGTVNSVNASFTVTAIPKWIVSDGTTYYENAGYTRSSLNITMDIPPSSYIRSIS
jgi:hypothetical protein